jgi:hypothetical protein
VCELQQRVFGCLHYCAAVISLVTASNAISRVSTAQAKGFLNAMHGLYVLLLPLCVSCRRACFCAVRAVDSRRQALGVHAAGRLPY